MSIKNTGDLRAMLLETIDDVKNGKIDSKQASAIALLSSKVLSSAKLDLDMLRYNSLSSTTERAGEKVLQLVNA